MSMLINIPAFEQPVYDVSTPSTMENYSPIGNYYYIRDAGGDTFDLHKIAFDECEQYTAQALIPALESFRKLGNLGFRAALDRMGLWNIDLVRPHLRETYRNTLRDHLA